MAIKLVECLDWAAPNRPGEMLRYAEKFKKDGVNLDAFWAYTSHANESKLAAIAKKPAKLKAALRAMGAAPNASQCFYTAGKDKSGALVDVLRGLREADINVECADALAAQGRYAFAFWVKEADVPSVKRLLKVR